MSWIKLTVFLLSLFRRSRYVWLGITRPHLQLKLKIITAQDIPGVVLLAVISSCASETLINVTAREVCRSVEGIEQERCANRMFEITSTYIAWGLHSEQILIKDIAHYYSTYYSNNNPYVLVYEWNIVHAFEHGDYKTWLDGAIWFFQNLGCMKIPLSALLS